MQMKGLFVAFAILLLTATAFAQGFDLFPQKKIIIIQTPGGGPDSNSCNCAGTCLLLNGSNQASWTPTTTLVPNLNADRVDSLHVGTTGGAIPNMAATNSWSGKQIMTEPQGWEFENDSFGTKYDGGGVTDNPDFYWSPYSNDTLSSGLYNQDGPGAGLTYLVPRNDFLESSGPDEGGLPMQFTGGSQGNPNPTFKHTKAGTASTMGFYVQNDEETFCYVKNGRDVWCSTENGDPNAFVVSGGATVNGDFTVTGTCTGCGSGGTPGGSDTQVQFNNGGSFGGDANFRFNGTTDVLTTFDLNNRRDVNIARDLNVGRNSLFTGNVVISKANPSLSLVDSAGDDYNVQVDSGTWKVKNITTGTSPIQVATGGEIVMAENYNPPQTGQKLYVQKRVTDPSSTTRNAFGAQMEVLMSGPGGASGNFGGFQGGTTIFTSAGSFGGGGVGFGMRADMSGFMYNNNTIDAMSGVLGSIQTTKGDSIGGIVTSANSFTNFNSVGADANIVDLIVYRAAPAQIAAGGKVTNQYAFYDTGMTGATNNWGVYSLSNRSYFDGNLEVDKNIDVGVALLPDTNNGADLGSPLKRFSNAYVINLVTGDINFSNGMYLREPDVNSVCLYLPNGTQAGCFDGMNGLTSSQGIKLTTPTSTPTCNSANRGRIWVSPGALGVADQMLVCAKTALDTYVWKVVSLV